MTKHLDSNDRAKALEALERGDLHIVYTANDPCCETQDEMTETIRQALKQPSLDAIIEKIEGLKAVNPTVEGWSISRVRVNHKLDEAIKIIKEAK